MTATAGYSLGSSGCTRAPFGEHEHSQPSGTNAPRTHHLWHTRTTSVFCESFGVLRVLRYSVGIRRSGNNLVFCEHFGVLRVGRCFATSSIFVVSSVCCGYIGALWVLRCSASTFDVLRGFLCSASVSVCRGCPGVLRVVRCSATSSVFCD